ncbi:hypothetical protein [Pedobacter rhodius]|uniref:DUF4468 domain-containing protein n=1 Tax=Pedobacter rhodius TaxID=3004098 RepID=A0ABT4L104_9SPHI|nr:hypothetical protein [Pedobacter sp. SJ11]MCZ4224869.1 hypothetical protein [Pedobacter sp. SJ11]
MTGLRLLFFLLFSVYSYASVSAQIRPNKPAVAKSANAQDAEISNIRNLYNQINASTLKKEKFNYEASGCVEEGEVIYFMNGKTIVKITESGSIGDGSWKSEYYYQSGKVIFYFESMTGGPAIGKVTKTERRVYIENDRPIRNMENKKIIKVDARSAEVIQTAYKLLIAYQTKDFAAALCNPN